MGKNPNTHADDLKYKFKLSLMNDGHEVITYGDIDWIREHGYTAMRCIDLSSLSLTPGGLGLSTGERFMISLRSKKQYCFEESLSRTNSCHWKTTDRIWLGTLIYSPDAGRKTLSCYPNDHRKHPNCQVVPNEEL